MPELRSDQVRTRRCNCNGHNTARALGSTLQLGVADSPSLPVDHRTAGTNHARPMHDNVRTDGTGVRDGPSFSLPVSLREDANESRKAEHERHSLSRQGPPSSREKGRRGTYKASLAFMSGKKSRWFLSSSSLSLTCPPRSSSLCLVFIYSLGLRKKSYNRASTQSSYFKI